MIFPSCREQGESVSQLQVRQGEHKEITLDNVIYLPESPNNLISISRWSRDRGDDCGILSRGEYSIFLWDNDKSQKLMEEGSSCILRHTNIFLYYYILICLIFLYGLRIATKNGGRSFQSYTILRTLKYLRHNIILSHALLLTIQLNI